MAVFNGKRFVFEFEKESPLKKKRVSAEQRKTLNHYTSMESLLKIFDTKTLKMNSIKNLNDKEEAHYIAVDHVDDLVFISSFCYVDESIPLWHMYTEPKYGVNIKFNYQKSKESFSKAIFDEDQPIQGKVSYSDTFYAYNNTSTKLVVKDSLDWQVALFEADVQYDNNGIKDYKVSFPCEDGSNCNYYNLNSLGVVKHSAWSYENETRLVAQFRTTKTKVEMQTLDYILIPITFNKLENIVITFSPWMSPEVKELIKKYIGEKVTECKVEYEDSKFTGLIERKL
ncbi:MAG: DUF2971 domain-containing protein [Eubacteriaceae bacterium]